MDGTTERTTVKKGKGKPSDKNISRDHIPAILSVGFLVVYAFVQVYCITHGNNVTDIISARLQDILIMIVSYYFGSSNKEKPSPP
jgi:hypothetical protein